MPRHLSIPSIEFPFSTPGSRATRTTIGDKRPAGEPFPCRYHSPGALSAYATLNLLHRAPQQLPRQSYPFLGDAKRPRHHRQRRLTRTSYTDFCSRFADRETLSLSLLNGPVDTVSAHDFRPSTLTAQPTR